MWRVQGFVGRVLNRFHGNASLRLAQNHHVEDEVISSSSVLSTTRPPADCSSQNGEDGEQRRKQRTSHFCYAGLPRYTALDAVGWGAAAVLVMHICRKIHSQFSPGSETATASPRHLTASSLHKCGYRLLLDSLSGLDVLPRGRRAGCLQGLSEINNQAQAQVQSSSSSSLYEHDPETSDSSFSDHERADQSQQPLSQGKGEQQQDKSEDNTKDVLSGQQRLEAAASNFRDVSDSSVPVILNIIGLESAKGENHQAAFSCFRAAAQHGYSKAQFNTGVCYETGRGVDRDMDKALHYYHQAAIGGHSLAQYRYAKLLVTFRGRQNMEELNTAISLLTQAAIAGLVEAQVYLGKVFAQDPVRDGHRCVHFLKMAAERGDNTALLFLGQCYESGFGVKQDMRAAMQFYRKAAQAGNRHAKSLLTPPVSLEDDTVLRHIRSAPCFSIPGCLRQTLSSLARPVPPAIVQGTPTPLLPHSWSTGSLDCPSSLTSLPPHLHPHPQAPLTEGGPCRWTLGIG